MFLANECGVTPKVYRILEKIALAFFVFWIMSFPSGQGYASDILDQLSNTKNDVEESRNMFVKKKSRFVAVPIPKSDPTIGTGMALAGIYMHPQGEDDTTALTSMSGVVGLYTDTDSWGVGIFHDGFYSEDKFRVRAILMYGELNLSFYGIGNDSFLRNYPIDYKAKATGFLPRVMYRIPNTNWFLGPRYVFVRVDNTFDLSSLLPILPEIEVPTKTAGLGLVAVYDTRDNNLWPDDGTWFEFTATDYGDHFGGDFEYSKYILKWAQYFPLRSDITLAYRIDGQFIDGNAPFYDLSSIRLRGFPGGRYSDDSAITAQVEGRWNLYGNWTALLFGGGGRIAKELGDFGSSTTRYAGGVGIRYNIAKDQKLNIGVDITFGDDEVNLYVQIGDWLGN
jgi:hypothetical protein